MTNLARIRIGTRKSALALTQAEIVRAALIKAWPGLEAVLEPIVTTGDRITDRPLYEAGGKGLFTKEIEDALLDGRIDIAVHSVKDMLTVLPGGLALGCIMKREDARDRLVAKGVFSLHDLPRGARVGTSSLRRAAQLLMHRPDFQITELRGNVPTRLEKVEKGEVQATLLAQAGLNRLCLTEVPGFTVDPQIILPAVAQGALGIECRAGNTPILEMLAPLSHRETEIAVRCERAFLRALDGSCRTPIAGHATVQGSRLHLQGLVLRPDGSEYHSSQQTGEAEDAERMGHEEGHALLKRAGPGFFI